MTALVPFGSCPCADCREADHEALQEEILADRWANDAALADAMIHLVEKWYDNGQLGAWVRRQTDRQFINAIQEELLS